MLGFEGVLEQLHLHALDARLVARLVVDDRYQWFVVCLYCEMWQTQ